MHFGMGSAHKAIPHNPRPPCPILYSNTPNCHPFFFAELCGTSFPLVSKPHFAAILVHNFKASLGWSVPDHFQFFQCSAAGGDTEHVHLSYPESV